MWILVSAESSNQSPTTRDNLSCGRVKSSMQIFDCRDQHYSERNYTVINKRVISRNNQRKLTKSGKGGECEGPQSLKNFKQIEYKEGLTKKHDNQIDERQQQSKNFEIIKRIATYHKQQNSLSYSYRLSAGSFLG